MMSRVLTTAQLKEENFKLMPWQLSACLDLVLQGVLSSQFVNDYSYNSDDHRSHKMIVAVLALLTVPKSIQVFAIIEIMFIMYYGNLDAAIFLNSTTWPAPNT
ncbi:hypothetical protein B0H14DRAFT_3473819 [Mycena olivaceomarginata]|nr:hypothetical protein B0H14DRAFT_3473819 [Mycena olivaceomarginata]